MADLLRVSIGGSMPSGEVWSINPCYAFTAPLALSTDELAAAAAAIDAITIPAGLLSLMVPSVQWTGVRVEARDANGDLEGVAEHTRAVPVSGTSSESHPAQTSFVLSLRTADSSARGKGRLYFPSPGALILNGTLRYHPTTVSGFLTASNAYLASVRTAIRGVGGMTTAALAVWSRANASTRIVLSLRAGDVPDVQRRRRDKMVESYSSAVVSAV